MNAAYEPLGLPTQVKLNDSRVRIIVAMCSHDFIDGDLAHQPFNEILNKVQSEERNVVLDADSFTSHQLSGIHEWSKT